ncbi:MAG: hypothetical protein U0797_11130 [Gemmataceae bacterium]
MRARPVLDRLEDRCTPASVRAVAGILLITDPVGPLSVSVLAPGVVNVTDSATSANFSGIGSLISVRGTNLPDQIAVRANGVPFPGNVVINSLNGGDAIDLSGTFNGNVTVIPGLGNDAVVSTAANVRVGGVLTVADVAGANTWLLNGRSWSVGLDLTYYGLTAFAMGATGQLRVGRFASLTAIQPVASSMSLAFNGLLTSVGRTFSITGGSAANLVSFTSKLTVGGNLFVSERGGATNAFHLTPAAGSTGVNGSLFYTGGTGPDSIVVGTNSAVGGNASFDLGNGNNSLMDGAGSTYSGDVTIFGGNDVTKIGLNGTIDGGLTLFAGNGTNTVNVTRVPSGLFRFRGGNGADTLTLRGAGVYNMDASFGTGTNKLDTDQADLILSGTVMGSGGDNTFDQGAATLLPPLFFIDFPV